MEIYSLFSINCFVRILSSTITHQSVCRCYITSTLDKVFIVESFERQVPWHLLLCFSTKLLVLRLRTIKHCTSRLRDYHKKNGVICTKIFVICTNICDSLNFNRIITVSRFGSILKKKVNWNEVQRINNTIEIRRITNSHCLFIEKKSSRSKT